MWRLRSGAENLFSRDRVDRDLDDEVRSYAHMLRDENAERGMKPDEARRMARMEMGGPEQLKEEVRGARAGAWFESRDAGFAIRDADAAEESGFRRDRDSDARAGNRSEHGDLQRDSRSPFAGAAVSRSIANRDGARHRSRPADGFDFVS